MAQIFRTTIFVCFAFGYVHSQAKIDSCAEVDTDYKGGDIKLELNVASWRACGKSCKSSKQCEVFTYVTKTKCCYHKSASALKNKQSGKGLISAKQDCGLPLDISLSPGVSMKKTDGGGCFFPKQTRLQKNTKLGTLASLGKTYQVSFEMFPISIQKGWTNIIHLTLGENVRRYGDRIPAVFFWQTGNANTPADLFIAAAVNNNKNHFKKASSRAPLKKWYSVKIQQQEQGGKYVYSLFINGKQIHSVVNNRPTVFKNIQVFASDPWMRATEIWIRNLCLSNRPM